MKSKLTQFLIGLFLLGGLASVAQPTYNRAFKAGSSGYDGGYEIVTDANGNLYVTGWFENTVDFDPGVPQSLFEGQHSHSGVSRSHVGAPHSHLAGQHSHPVVSQSHPGVQQSHFAVQHSHLLTQQNNFVAIRSHLVALQNHFVSLQNHFFRAFSRAKMPVFHY